jgi:hypothetical protein
MTKKEQALTKELQRKNMLIEATKELVSLQRQRIEEVTKLLAKQKRLTDKLIEVNTEAFESTMTFSQIERDLTKKMNKQVKVLEDETNH